MSSVKIYLFVAMYISLDWHAFFFHHSGNYQGFCMMCTMETHINRVLCCAHDAIKPAFVVHELKRK